MESKEYWITNSRFKFIAILLLIIFLTFMSLIYFQGENIANDPCTICAKKMGDSVICTTMSGTYLLTKEFEPNGTILGER